MLNALYSVGTLCKHDFTGINCDLKTSESFPLLTLIPPGGIFFFSLTRQSDVLMYLAGGGGGGLYLASRFTENSLTLFDCFSFNSLRSSLFFAA